MVGQDGAVRRTCGGFTLMEALAAVVTLGLLAAAVVPLLRHLGRSGLGERIQAQAYLRTLTSPDGLVPATAMAIPGHPGWNLVVSELFAEAEPAPPSGRPPAAGPSRQWLLVGIHADGEGAALAQTLVVVLPAGARP